MSELSYFFDSSGVGVNYYNTAQITDWLYQAQARPNGVIAGLDNAMAITTTGALNSTYNTGIVAFQGHIYKNTASLSKTHVAPTAGFRRIDSVVVRFDNVTLLAANITIIQGVEKNDGSQVAPAITAGTDVLIATVLIDGTAANATTVSDARTWFGVTSLTTGSSPFTIPTNGPSLIKVSATTNPYIINLLAATGSGYRVKIVNTTALATGLVKIVPATGDKIGPLAANTACYLQNVDQSTWSFQEQSIELIDSKLGQWTVVTGQFMPEPGSVDSAGTQYHIGRLIRLPLGNTSSRQVGAQLFTAPNQGNFSSAFQVTGAFGIPAGAKAVLLNVYMQVAGNGSGSVFASDNTSSNPAIGTSHPVFRYASPGAAAIGSTLGEFCVPLNSLGQFFIYGGTYTGLSANPSLSLTVMGYYMGI